VIVLLVNCLCFEMFGGGLSFPSMYLINIVHWV